MQPSATPQRTWIKRVTVGLGWVALSFILSSVALVWVLRWPPVPTSSVMAQSWIRSLWDAKTPRPRYTWVPYAQISPQLALAVIAAEDQRFPHHAGFDWIELQNAWQLQSNGRRLRGASTISQQVAKNLFLWSGRSWLRKGLEAWLTLLLEGCWPKQRILEVYLNIVPFGDHTFGVAAASRHFFQQSARHLTASQAARLAAVLPNPGRYRVNQPSAYLLQRQRWIRRQMQQLGGVAYLNHIAGG